MEPRQNKKALNQKKEKKEAFNQILQPNSILAICYSNSKKQNFPGLSNQLKQNKIHNSLRGFQNFQRKLFLKEKKINFFKSETKIRGKEIKNRRRWKGNHVELTNVNGGT